MGVIREVEFVARAIRAGGIRPATACAPPSVLITNVAEEAGSVPLAARAAGGGKRACSSVQRAVPRAAPSSLERVKVELCELWCELFGLCELLAELNYASLL